MKDFFLNFYINSTDEFLLFFNKYGSSKYTIMQSDKSCSFFGVGDVMRREHERRPAAQRGCVVEYRLECKCEAKR